MKATHAQTLQTTYDTLAQNYDRARQSDVNTVHLFSFLDYVPYRGTILELGCGNGRDARQMKVERSDVKVILLDISEKMLELAKKKVPRSPVIQGDILTVELEDESLDGVWANASLLHLTKIEIRQALEKLYSAMKDKAIFHIVMKEGTGERDLTQQKYDTTITRFYSFYTLKELEKLLTTVGFDILQSESQPNADGKNRLRVLARKK